MVHAVSKTLEDAVDNNLIVRHGAIVGAGEVLLGLAGRSAMNNDPKTIEKLLYKHSGNYYLLSSREELTDADLEVLKDSENQLTFK